MAPHYTDAEEQTILRKFDRRLVLFIALLYMLSFLDRAHSVAPRNYSRWLVPPAALAIHLCIGQVYAFSVFKLPLTQVIGVTHHDPAAINGAGQWDVG